MDPALFLAEYDRRAGELHEAAALCERELRAALEDVHAVRSITMRVKARRSVENKLKRPDRRYDAFGGMVDLIGARVVTLLAEDVPAVIEVLERSFRVDGEQCWDMSWVLGTEDFGYRSIHYVLAPKVPEWPDDLVCEVQVRSLLQDAWAQIAHDFSYKSLLPVTESAHRRLSLAAGLLETADREFAELRASTTSYREEIGTSAHASIAELLVSSEELFGVDRAIAADAESALLSPPVGYLEHYAKMLAAAGFATAADAAARLGEEVDAVRAYARALIRRGRRPRVLYRGVALFYLCTFVRALEGEEALELYMSRAGLGLPGSRRLSVPLDVRAAREIRGGG